VASGNSNEDKANKAQSSAINALKPKAYADPYGKFKNNQFTPYLSEGVQGGMSGLESTIGGLAGQLNKPFDINSYYDNPFYATVSDQYKAPVLRQYDQDKKSLSNDLNARGQLGSSYDATMNRNLIQQRDFQLNQADDTARTASASAYQQQYNNLVQSLTAALTGRGQLLDQIYAPAKIALNYQQAVAPLQAGAANVYNTAQQQYLSRPTLTDRVMQYYAASANALGSMAGGI
jgi:hypothetical protein